MRMKFSSPNNVRATSTDCLFDSKIRSIFDKFMKDVHAIDKQHSLALYPTGKMLWFESNWGEVDHVFIPVFMDKRAHWILANFNLSKWHLDVYNSSFKMIRDVAVLAAVEPLCYIILHLLRLSKVLKFTTPDSSLTCILCKDVPQQTNGGDCGIFVIKYAEYTYHMKIMDMPKKFDTHMAQYNMVVQLYKYAIEQPDLTLPRTS
ncbi:Ulp1 protease family [Abeliophyllum distichum]|uniref:Ulp1 protease family n=1 Tax=Abeliophyllum distichum TaxID=126358 RepID=A0ABD1U2U8_9LAMI